jgi:uncharacterized protein
VIEITNHSGGVVLPILAQPGAKRDAVLGERAGMLRIAVTAAPDKGKANAAIQSFLAEFLGCKAAQVKLLSGATSRRKRFFIAGVAEDELSRRLTIHLRESGPSTISS